MPTGPNISVKLNFPRTELQVASWRKARSSRLFSGWGGQDGGWPQKVVFAPLAPYVWKEPNTGVLLMRPNVLSPQFWEGNNWYIGILKGLSDWLTGTNTFMDAPPNNYSLSGGDGVKFLMLSQRQTAAALIQDQGYSAALHALINTLNNALVQAAQTVPTFMANEGFSIWIYPPGTMTDRAQDYMGFSFGGRYYLHLRDGGTYQLYANAGYGTNTPNWTKVGEWRFKGGHVDHTKPILLTVIPFGFRYISFIFNQQDLDPGLYSNQLPTNGDDHFLYDIVIGENRNPVFDNTLQQYIKTEAAQIIAVLRQDTWQYGWGVSRVRYPTGDQGWDSVYPESMPTITPNTPVMSVEGFQGANDGVSGTIIEYYMGGDQSGSPNGVYQPNQSTLIWGNYKMWASGNGVYTPEIWAFDYYCKEVDFTPGWTPIDVSSDWRYLRFQRTTQPDPTKAEIKLRDDSRYSNLLTLGGTPINITVQGPSASLSMFDGYTEKRQPTIEGFNATISTHITAKDMWTRLDEKYTGDYSFLEGQTLGNVFFGLLQDAGFTSGQIFIDDPSNTFSQLTFEQFQDPNDRITVNPDATVGDVLRHFLKIFWVIPIRVLWNGTEWHIYTQPQYTYVAGTPPATVFSTKSFGLSDTKRYTNNIFHIKSDLEIDLEPIEFNCLIGRAVSGVAAHGEGIQSIIPNNQPNDSSSWAWRTVNDPTSPWFIGRTKIKYLNPPEIVLARDQGTLDLMTYSYWQKYYKKLPRLEFNAEWQPGIDVDQFIWIVGSGQTQDTTQTQFPNIFGNDDLLTSYGAWRIDHMDVECRWDRNGLDDTFTYMAKYTCVFVGKATGILGAAAGLNGGSGYNIATMWTTDANLPL